MEISRWLADAVGDPTGKDEVMDGTPAGVREGPAILRDRTLHTRFLSSGSFPFTISDQTTPLPVRLSRTPAGCRSSFYSYRWGRRFAPRHRLISITPPG
jgi:hypothetical protein